MNRKQTRNMKYKKTKLNLNKKTNIYTDNKVIKSTAVKRIP